MTTTPARRAGGDPAVTIVVVTWNAREPLLACLASLRQGVAAGTSTVVVVDNASTDGTVQAVASGAPWARIIANRTNRGLAAGNNQGIAASTTPYVLIANPDVVFEPGTVTALCQRMESEPRAGFVFARLVHPDGTLQTTAGDLPRFVDALLGRQANRRRSTGDRTGFWWDGWAHDRPARIGHGLEACYLVRRDAIAEIGVQDERFWLDWEGIDWCRRAAVLGWECWFEPAAQAVHLGGVSIRQAPTRWIAATHRSMYHYFAADLPRWSRPALAAIFSARGAAKLALFRRAASYERAHPGAGVAG